MYVKIRCRKYHQSFLALRKLLTYFVFFISELQHGGGRRDTVILRIIIYDNRLITTFNAIYLKV